MATEYNRSKIVTDNLVLYLDAANTKSYSGSGATWYDLSGNGNNGTIDGATFNTDVFDFDGTNDYISFSQYDFGTAISLFAFIKPISQNSIRTLFSNAGAGGSSNGLHFYLNNWNTTNNKLVIEYGDGSSGSNINSGTNTITNGIWQSVAYTYDKGNNTGSLYNNDNLWASDTSVTINSNLDAAFKLGQFQLVANYRYKGSVGIYMLYNRALTASEVKQNFDALKRRYGF